MKTPTQNQTVWVTMASSESGDDYGPYVFTHKLTANELEAFWREECPGECEDDDGPGNWGTYLHVSLVERTLITAKRKL